MFTVLFAIARTVGWIAQWKEMIEDPSQRIGRPRQLYPARPSAPHSDRGPLERGFVLAFGIGEDDFAARSLGAPSIFRTRSVIRASPAS